MDKHGNAHSCCEELSALRSRVEEAERERDEAQKAVLGNADKWFLETLHAANERASASAGMTRMFEKKWEAAESRAALMEGALREIAWSPAGPKPIDLMNIAREALAGRGGEKPTGGSSTEDTGSLPGSAAPHRRPPTTAPEPFEVWHRRECPELNFTKPGMVCTELIVWGSSGMKKKRRFIGRTCREVYAQERPEGGVGERPCAIVDGKSLWCCPTNHDLHYPTCHRDNHAILKARPSERDEALEEAARIIEAMRPTYCRADDATCVEATCIEARELLAKIRARKGER